MIKDITQNGRTHISKLTTWGNKIHNRGTEMSITFFSTQFVFKECWRTRFKP